MGDHFQLTVGSSGHIITWYSMVRHLASARVQEHTRNCFSNGKSSAEVRAFFQNPRFCTLILLLKLADKSNLVHHWSAGSHIPCGRQVVLPLGLLQSSFVLGPIFETGSLLSHPQFWLEHYSLVWYILS